MSTMLLQAMGGVPWWRSGWLWFIVALLIFAVIVLLRYTWRSPGPHEPPPPLR